MSLLRRFVSFAHFIIPTILLIAAAALAPAVPAAAATPPFDDPILVADLAPGPEGSDISFLLPVGEAAIFMTDVGLGSPTSPSLWGTDGTGAGTTEIRPRDLEVPPVPTVWWTERYVYFDGIDRETGIPSIWRTDGTEAGTIELVES